MTPAAPPPCPLEDDDLLEEILLRLPLQHSSLPLASAVCKRWLRLITDPKFIARFRSHHRKPPLLGVFHHSSQGAAFSPIIDTADRIPAQRFDPRRRYRRCDILGCRHGRVLAMHAAGAKLIVWDPITGKQRRVAVPSEFRKRFTKGSVLCADRAQGHVHGGCHSSPFKVVLMTQYTHDHQPVARVYSSETRTWCKTISTAAPCEFNHASIDGALVGNALYWLQHDMDKEKDILVFDLDEQSLAVIAGPPVTSGHHYGTGHIIQAEDGVVGLGVLSYPSFQMWQRNANCLGVATWVLWKTIGMDNILGIPRPGSTYMIHGYCEDTDAIFISLDGYVHMVQLKSMQSKRIHETRYLISSYHPFTSFYTPGACKDSAVLSKIFTSLQRGWQCLYR